MLIIRFCNSAKIPAVESEWRPGPPPMAISFDLAALHCSKAHAISSVASCASGMMPRIGKKPCTIPLLEV